MSWTHDRWLGTTKYIEEVFGQEDPELAGLATRARAAGLPDIAVSPEVGRLLSICTALAGGSGARLALEIGTLAGYSARWIARSLAPGGRLITAEPEPRHADFAEAEFAAAGLGDRIELRRRPGLEVLADLHRDEGPGCLDLVFLDAIKTEYPAYFAGARGLLRPGGILLADNALGTGSMSIAEPAGTSEARDALDRFNREVAADPDLEATIVPLRQGVLVARRRATG